MDTRQQDALIQKVFETEWFSIDAIPYESPNKKPYYRLSCNDSVCIIAKTVDNKLILVRQYRPAIGEFTLEFPSGYVDEGESAEEAIKREFTEETGFVCESVSCMGSLRIAPSRLNNTVHVFFGEEARRCGEKGHQDKGIELLLVPQGEFKKLIVDGAYLETGGMAMYLLAHLKGYL